MYYNLVNSLNCIIIPFVDITFSSCRKSFMFWSDTSSDRIFRAYLNGTGVTTLISSGLSTAGNEAS